MKKLLFVVHSLGGGGAEKVLIDLLKALDPTRYDITLVSVCGGVYEKSVPSYVKYKKIVKTKNKFLSKLFTKILFRMNKKLFAKLYLRGKYDFEIAYLEGNPTRQVAAKKSKCGKKIAFVHCDIIKNDPILAYYKTHERCFNEYNKYDKVCFVSKAAMNNFENTYGKLENSCVVHNVIDVDAVKSKAQCASDSEYATKGIKLISVGRLSPEKGYERLVRIATELEKTYDFELWILGDGIEREKLERTIKENDSKSIKLLGFQTNPYSYMKKADLYICPSFFEGYGMSILEAMLLGVPTLTTDCAGPRELLEDGKYGIIVENSDDGLRQGLKYILSNREALVELKACLAEKSKQMDMKFAVQEYENLFDEVNNEQQN